LSLSPLTSAPSVIFSTSGQYWGSTTSPLKFNRGGRSDSLPTKEKGTTEQHDEPQLTRISTTKPIGEFEPWIETVSWKPRVFLYHNFLTQAECDEVLQLGMFTLIS